MSTAKARPAVCQLNIDKTPKKEKGEAFGLFVYPNSQEHNRNSSAGY
jgi:hypothetical protein